MDLKREQALVRAAQNGNGAALGELYEAYVDNIYRYLYYRVDSHETAQDITSEVFTRFVEGLKSYQDRNIPLLAWLYQITRARLVDYYRRNGRTGESPDIETLDLRVDDNLDGSLMSDYTQTKVREAIRKLTLEQQQVIHMRFIEGYSLQKTADILGKSVIAVKVMQHRALQSLKRMLTKQGVTYE